MKRLLLPISLIVVLLCAGCGQKGDLYLPSPTAPPADAPTRGPDDGAPDQDQEHDQDQDRDRRDDGGNG